MSSGQFWVDLMPHRKSADCGPRTQAQLEWSCDEHGRARLICPRSAKEGSLPTRSRALVNGASEEVMIDLYTWTTPNGRKVSVMLEECGIPYNVHPVNIRNGDQFKPEFVKICPN